MPDGERELWHFSRDQSDEAGRLLGRHVRAWTDSGLQSDGSEIPESRQYATWGCQAIFEAMGGLLNCFLTIPQGPPLPTVFGLQASNRHQTTQRGALSICMEPRGGIRAAPMVFRGYLSPEELAAWGFLLFWQSPWLFTIMRCARCNVFVIPSRKPRKSYRRGWHCEQCRNKASAAAATADTRNTIRDRWFGRAVAAWLKCKSQPRRSTKDRCVLFLMERVNKGLPYSSRIKRNTITHNLGKIQAAAEGRTENAKG